MTKLNSKGINFMYKQYVIMSKLIIKFDDVKYNVQKNYIIILKFT